MVTGIKRHSSKRHSSRGIPAATPSSAPRNAIVFRATDAQRPFVTRNAELLAFLAPQFEEELKQESGDENFAERVRLAIQQKLTGRRPTIEDIADALHISSRTLQRRLQDSGSSFQRILEEARHQLARHYLNNSVLELNEAAYLLGYETQTPSFALSALGKELHPLAGAKSSVQRQRLNRAPFCRTACELAFWGLG